MAYWRSFGLAIFAAVCLLSGTFSSAHAQSIFATEWSNGTVINLGGLPGSTRSEAYGINDAGQVVGFSVVNGVDYATEWSNGQIINLGGGIGYAINNAGQVVGIGPGGAAEWSNGQVINLGGAGAYAINRAGQVAGTSAESGGRATEWSNGSVIDLGGPGVAYGMNDAEQAVGVGVGHGGVASQATEWIDGNVIDLESLPGFQFGASANDINDAGQIVGASLLDQAYTEATEWIDGNVISLGPPGSDAEGINDNGQVVGSSPAAGFFIEATEWSGGNVIALGGLPGAQQTDARSINNLGQAVGYSLFFPTPPPPAPVPEPSTWAMMLLGFAGLGLVGYRQTRAAEPQAA